MQLAVWAIYSYVGSVNMLYCSFHVGVLVRIYVPSIGRPYKITVEYGKITNPYTAISINSFAVILIIACDPVNIFR